MAACVVALVVETVSNDCFGCILFEEGSARIWGELQGGFAIPAQATSVPMQIGFWGSAWSSFLRCALGASARRILNCDRFLMACSIECPEKQRWFLPGHLQFSQTVERLADPQIHCQEAYARRHTHTPTHTHARMWHPFCFHKVVGSGLARFSQSTNSASRATHPFRESIGRVLLARGGSWGVCLLLLFVFQPVLLVSHPLTSRPFCLSWLVSAIFLTLGSFFFFSLPGAFLLRTLSTAWFLHFLTSHVF